MAATDTSAFSLFGNETPEMVLERLRGEQRQAFAAALAQAKQGKTRNEQLGSALGAGLGLLLRHYYNKPENDPAYKRATQNEDVQKAFSDASSASTASAPSAAPMDVADQNAINGDMMQQTGVPARPVEQQVAEHAQATAGSGSADAMKGMLQGYDAAINKATALGRSDIARALVMERAKLQSDYEEKQANLNKLRSEVPKNEADAALANAKVDEINAGGQPAEYGQLVQRNELLRQRLSSVPADSVAADSIQRQIKENEGRLEYLRTRVGRTPQDIGTPMQTELQKDILAKSKTLDNLRGIKDAFKPEYLQYSQQVKQFGTTQLAKLGVPLSPELLKSNDDYREFSRENYKLLNDTIREVTGATVGNTQESLFNPSEAGRIRAQVPNNDDTAGSYANKYNTVYWMTAAAAARSQAALEKNDLTILRRPLTEFTSAVDPSYFIGDYKIKGAPEQTKPKDEPPKVERISTPQGEVTVEWH